MAIKVKIFLFGPQILQVRNHSLDITLLDASAMAMHGVAEDCACKINGTYEGGIYLSGGFFREGEVLSERDVFLALTSPRISVNSQEYPLLILILIKHKGGECGEIRSVQTDRRRLLLGNPGNQSS